MNIFERLLSNRRRQKGGGSLGEKSFSNSSFSLSDDDFNSNLYIDPFTTDTYLCSAWVNIAVNILIRNVARADFILERDGIELKNGSLYSLFHRPNEHLSRFDLWKETAAWWC